MKTQPGLCYVGPWAGRLSGAGGGLCSLPTALFTHPSLALRLDLAARSAPRDLIRGHSCMHRDVDGPLLRLGPSESVFWEFGPGRFLCVSPMQQDVSCGLGGPSTLPLVWVAGSVQGAKRGAPKPRAVGVWPRPASRSQGLPAPLTWAPGVPGSL